MNNSELEVHSIGKRIDYIDRNRCKMVLASLNMINEALEERVGSTRLFSTATTNYTNTANEISGIQLDLVNNRLRKVSLEHLEKLRHDLINKYSTAKTQIDHSKLSYENLDNEANELGDYLSPESISHKREELMKNFLTSKKKIDELTKKKVEVREVNRIIGSFNSVQELSYTEEDLDAIFGDEAQSIKSSSGVVKRSSMVTVKRDVEVSGNGNGNGNGDASTTEEDGAKEDSSTPEFEQQEITKYYFRANLGNTVEKLREAQEGLQRNIEQYEKEIQEIKARYIANVRKFEAIRKIVGCAADEEDVEMEDAVAPGSVHSDREPDEDLTTVANVEDDADNIEDNVEVYSE